MDGTGIESIEFLISMIVCALALAWGIRGMWLMHRAQTDYDRHIERYLKRKANGDADADRLFYSELRDLQEKYGD